MSLGRLSGARSPDNFISRNLERSLNTEMTRLEFLQMGGALVLTAVGVQNLVSTFMKHTTNSTSPTSLLTRSGDGFGTRKFGG
jgi:hypothetical protein